ncbi:MAG TPA: cyclase family protein [Natronosporangium sp.]
MSALLDAVTSGIAIHDLSQPFEPGMPCSPNHPGFRMALQRRHGDMVRPDGGSAANELIVTGGHVGTHIDALCHVSHQGRLFGGHDAQAAQVGGRFTVHGAETIPPVLRRGVLLDVAGLHGVPSLPGGYGIDADDLRRALKQTGAELKPGDVALVRTGWARHWSDPTTYLGHDTGVPGVTESGASWLAEQRISITGADTTAYERIPPGQGHRLLPVHRILLVEAGIYIVEHMRLELLAEHRVSEFLFVLAPLPIVGGTASPVRPLAVVPG